MPGADVQRLHTVTGAQHRADALVLVHQRRDRAAPLPGLPMGAAQPRFGAADGGQADDEPQMRGEAHPARVRDALAVTEDAAHRRLQPAQYVQKNRYLAEGEQTRHVGEAQRRPRGPGLHHRLSGRVPDDADRDDGIIQECAVQPGDATGQRCRPQLDAVPKPSLHGHRLLRREVPRVGRPRDLHVAPGPGLSLVSNPISIAFRTARVRSRTPSLPRILDTWFLIVPSDLLRAVAISRLL